jgi:hypothetical protein
METPPDCLAALGAAYREHYHVMHRIGRHRGLPPGDGAIMCYRDGKIGILKLSLWESFMQ